MADLSLATHLQSQTPRPTPRLSSPTVPLPPLLFHSMETGQTVQESALHAGRHAWWPLDTMACSLDDASTINSFLLGYGWDPQHCYFGLGATGAGAGDSDTHGHARELELFVPKCIDSPVVSEASTAAATGWTMQKDATAMPGELDELLMSLLDSDKEHAVGFSSCSALKEASATSSQYDGHSDLSSILPTLPTSPDKTPAPAQAELSASSTSHCNVDLRTSDTGAAQQQQHQTTRANSSSKRSAPEEKGAEGGESSKRSRKQALCSTAGSGAGTVAAYPFAVVKPGGADGSVTLADINRWILTPSARPVRHPVGEFACAPRVSAGHRPSPSGRTVAGFIRLHTAGRGTVTIVRTRGG